MEFFDRIKARGGGSPTAAKNTDSLWTTPWSFRDEDDTYYGYNEQVWLYRSLPVNPIEWEDPNTKLELGQQLSTLLGEIGSTSSVPVGAIRSLSNNREIHIISISWDEPAAPPEGTSDELAEFQRACLGYVSPRKALFIGIRLRPSGNPNSNSSILDQARRVATKVLLEDVPDRSAYRSDREMIGSMCARAGGRRLNVTERDHLESWFNNGRGPDTTLVENTTSIDVPSFDTFEMSAVMRFNNPVMHAPNAQWVLEAASHQHGPKVISIRAELEPSVVTRSRARRSQRRIEATMQEEAATGDLERIEYSATFQQAQELERFLVGVGEPILTKCSIILARPVRSSDETYIEFLRNSYGIEVKPLEHRQIRALDETLPASSRRVNPFLHDVSISMLAYAGLNGFSNLGDRVGAYVGMALPDYTPVFLDVIGAPRENLPPAMLIAGDPGSGKTFLCQTLALQAALEGHTVIFINPKGFDSLAPFAELVDGRVVKMSAFEKLPGAFDPFRYAPPAVAAEIASSHILSVLGNVEHGFTQPQQLELSSALKRAAQVGARCVGDAFPFISDQSIVVQIRQQVEGSSLFALGVGLEPQSELGGEGGLTLIEFDRKLDLPDPSKSSTTYTRNELIALAAVRLITRASMELLTKSGKSGMLVVDEAWTFLGYPEGLAALQQIGREGRSLGILPVFATQRIADVVSRDMETYLSRVFCMKMTDEREARAALNLCGLDPTPSRIAWLRDAGPRRGDADTPARPAMALHRDLRNRHSAVLIGPVPESVRLAISTNPEDRSEREQSQTGDGPIGTNQ